MTFPVVPRELEPHTPTGKFLQALTGRGSGAQRPNTEPR